MATRGSCAFLPFPALTKAVVAESPASADTSDGQDLQGELLQFNGLFAVDVRGNSVACLNDKRRKAIVRRVGEPLWREE
jgi:hypothetical protein